MPDVDTRHTLLLILAVLERHSRALRTLLARAGRPELKGLLGDFERRERALREAARELRHLEACRTTGPRRCNGSDDGDPVRQGVLPLPEPTRTTDAAAPGCVIHSAVERRSEKLGTAKSEGDRQGLDDRGRREPPDRRDPPRGGADAGVPEMRVEPTRGGTDRQVQQKACIQRTG